MLHSVKEMYKYKILAIDGEIGQIEDLYFDERFNTVRYAVVNTGGFLFKNLVLISPIFIDTILADEKLIKMSLTKEEVENSPDVDAETPVSRVYEEKFYKHFRTLPYWSGFLSWGAVPIPMDLRSTENIPEAKSVPAADEEEHYLRSANEILGYKCETRDGKAGYIQDFYLNPENWRIETFLLKTGHLSAGEDIEIDMGWIDRFSYPEKMAFLGMNINELAQIQS